jgi:hypothetical protein
MMVGRWAAVAVTALALWLGSHAEAAAETNQDIMQRLRAQQVCQGRCNEAFYRCTSGPEIETWRSTHNGDKAYAVELACQRSQRDCVQRCR